MSNKHTNNASKCRICDEILDIRVKRNILIKTLLFWLPIKVYFCARCANKRYVIERRHTYDKVKTA